MYKLIIFGLIFINSFSQNYTSAEVRYSGLYSKLEIKESSQQNVKDLFTNINENLNDKEFVLKINSKGFYFKEAEKVNLDENKYSKIANTIFLVNNFFYLKDNSLLIKEIGDAQIETDFAYDWSLLNETKEIDKFLCYKAECVIKFNTRSGSEGSRVITAWYTPQINFNYGPNGYIGLPGLILELEYNKTKLVAKEIKLFKNEISIDFPKTKSISEKEFVEKTKIN